VNRGWVPLRSLSSLSRPPSTVSLVGVVEREGEKGGRFAPVNDFAVSAGEEGGREGGREGRKGKRKPLLWVDLLAIERWLLGEEGEEGGGKGATEGQLHYFIQLQEEAVSSSSSFSSSSSSSSSLSSSLPSWPVPKAVTDVGQFYVQPSTHLVYALTWFSLAGAGAIMTRRILRPKIRRG